MIARRLPTFVALLALAAASFAQGGKVAFDPARDLPGYEAVRASLDRDLYPLDEFEALLGNELSPAQLAEVQQRWTAAKGAVDTRLAELAKDPRAAFLFRLESRLGRHAYFSKIAWNVQPAPEPFVLVVQRPPKDDPAHAQRVADLYAPWLASLAREFDARVGGPAQAKPRADQGAVALAVLATPGDYQTAGRYLDFDVTAIAGGLHDARLRIGVGHDDPFAGTRSTKSRVRPLVTMAAVGLLQRHHAGNGLPGSVLITVGLPHLLFESLGDGTKALDVPRVRPDALSTAVAALADPGRRFEFLIRLPDLLSIVDDSGASGLESRQARRVGANQVSDRRAYWETFDAQCGLWVHFLLHGDGGAHVERWRRYVAAVLGGKSGPDALKSAYEGADLAAIERAFWTWVVAAAREAMPSAPAPPADAVDALLAGPPSARPNAAVAPTDAAAAKPAPPQPPLDPRALAIGADDTDSRVGMALVRARDGDLAGAAADLEAVAVSKPLDPWSGRIAREVVRLRAALALRDGWIAALQQKGGRIELELDGQKVAAPVKGVEDGVLVLAPNKSKVERVPLARIRPADLLRGTDKKEHQSGAEPWVRAFVAMLAGDDAKVEKLLKGDSEGARDLREDMRVWRGETLRAGGAARILERVASRTLPAKPEEGAAAIEDVRALLAEGDLPAVVLRHENLERYARAALEAQAGVLAAGELVRGELSAAQDGLTRLVYDFQEPDEVDDLAKVPGHVASLRKLYPALKTSEADAAVRARDGRAVFEGPASWRLPLDFQAPFTVRYTFRFPGREGEMTAPPSLALFLCDDGRDSYVRASEFGWIHAVDRATSRSAEAKPANLDGYFDDTDYDVEIAHDGARVVTRFAGADRATCNVGNLRAGSIVIFAHAEQTVALERIEVEGHLVPASVEAARRAWVRRGLEQLGF